MSLPTTGTGRSVWSVQFYKENDGIDFGSGADIDDLLLADCTIECYARLQQSASSITILGSKAAGSLATGWYFYVNPGTSEIAFLAQFATNDIALLFSRDMRDGIWHHYAVDWDVGTLTARLFVDGALLVSDVAIGAYQSDAARTFFVNAIVGIGTNDSAFSIGPIRISNSRRYTGASFDPPRRINWPANDANAQLIARMNDGAGATVTDYSGNGYNGTITFGANTRWYNDPV